MNLLDDIDKLPIGKLAKSKVSRSIPAGVTKVVITSKPPFKSYYFWTNNHNVARLYLALAKHWKWEYVDCYRYFEAIIPQTQFPLAVRLRKRKACSEERLKSLAYARSQRRYNKEGYEYKTKRDK